MMISDDAKVRLVCFAYRQAVHEVYSKYVGVHIPEIDSKMYQNCLEITSFCTEFDIDLHTYMILAFDCYDKAWIANTFGTVYPPFTLVASEKVRGKIEKMIKDALKSKESDVLTVEKYVEKEMEK